MTLTIAELKKHIDMQGTVHDELLQAYLDAALDQAQAPPPWGCGRLLAPDPASEDDDPVERPEIRTFGSTLIRVGDARELTDVSADGDTITDYEVTRRNGLIVGLELAADAKKVVLTGRFGFLEIPPSLREAIYMLAGRYWYERSAQYADQVADAEGGPVQAYYRQLPPRTKLAFKTFSVTSDSMGVGGI